MKRCCMSLCEMPMEPLPRLRRGTAMEESVVSAAAAVLAPAPIVGHFVVVTMKRKCSDWHGKFNPGSRQRMFNRG